MVKRGLYFMAKPPLKVAELAWYLPRTDKTRGLSQPHVTLLPLFDLAAHPADLLTDLLRLMHSFEAPAFRVVFDQIVEHGYVMLRGSEPILGARRFQERLRRFLEARGFHFFRSPDEAHMTLRYDRDGLGEQPIDPISWIVEEFFMIESVAGQHLLHGQWKLRLD